MKVLHIQDAWEIPRFVEQVQEQIARGMCHILDVTDHYGDSDHHFLFSHIRIAPEEVEQVLNSLQQTD